MTFKEFIMKEAMTSTSCVATFSRITLPMVTRMYPPAVMWDMNNDKVEDEKKGRKRVKKQPQVEE